MSDSLLTLSGSGSVVAGADFVATKGNLDFSSSVIFDGSWMSSFIL